MSKYVSTHALERSVRQLAIGGVVDLDKKRLRAGFDSLSEIEHQFQVPLSGTASSGIGWTKAKVAFDVAFLFVPEQRNSPLATPHFTFGAVVSGTPPNDGAPDANNPDCYVAVFATVDEWARDGASDAIVGAIVGIGVSTLGGSDVDFQGYVHLNFQGYGAPIESGNDAAPLS